MTKVTIQKDRAQSRAERDFVALGIAAAAIIMFLGTGGTVLPQIVRTAMGVGTAPDRMLVNALLLNVALIIFGWRRYVDLKRELGERRKAEETARRLAETDPLTGCLNRRCIAQETDRLIGETAATGREVSFVMVDLDNFKLVNDLNGHKVGDAVLLETAARIAALLPPDALLARLGGDEFACVVPFDASCPERIDQLIVRIVDRVAVPIACGGLSAEVTVSVGVAATTGEADKRDAAGLMHQADIAMYHAKKQGRNRYFWFEEAMESELRLRNDLETGIRRGIRGGEFVPHYEQQVDLATGELTGFEMLARWRSPELGLVSPEVFIPIAEEIGVIGELSEILIGRALDDAKEWDPSLTLSVNVSPVQMRDAWFSQKIVKLLVEHNFPPQRLDLEITESCLHDNLAVVHTIITSLRNQGVKISLDDFGTGYSSLAQLRSLPFDRLKIDRSFVTELKDENASGKIVSAIIALAEGLDMPITAEGIEDERILATLKKLGRLKGQGYHYGKPEDAEAVRTRLAALGLLAAPPAEESGAAPADATLRERQQAAG
ncbi:MAG: putative bifunctional diguanylate cyclase/phosphodiesterase [Tsuneonella sp.]